MNSAFFRQRHIILAVCLFIFSGIVLFPAPPILWAQGAGDMSICQMLKTPEVISGFNYQQPLNESDLRHMRGDDNGYQPSLTAPALEGFTGQEWRDFFISMKVATGLITLYGAPEHQRVLANVPRVFIADGNEMATMQRLLPLLFEDAISAEELKADIDFAVAQIAEELTCAN